jgi:hypothetical protein
MQFVTSTGVLICCKLKRTGELKKGFDSDLSFRVVDGSGVKEAGRSCCEMSRDSSGVLCEKEGPVCRDRTQYVFFDGLHPTDSVNARIARKGYGSRSPQHAYPINVKQLAML